jgi:hypothetical protein
MIRIRFTCVFFSTPTVVPTGLPEPTGPLAIVLRTLQREAPPDELRRLITDTAGTCLCDLVGPIAVASATDEIVCGAEIFATFCEKLVIKLFETSLIRGSAEARQTVLWERPCLEPSSTDEGIRIARTGSDAPAEVACCGIVIE